MRNGRGRTGVERSLGSVAESELEVEMTEAFLLNAIREEILPS